LYIYFYRFAYDYCLFSFLCSCNQLLKKKNTLFYNIHEYFVIHSHSLTFVTVDCRLLGGLDSVCWLFLASCCGTLSVDAFLTREISAFRTVSMNREPLPLLPEADTSFVVGLTGQTLKPEFPRLSGPPRNSAVLVCSSSVRDSNKADLVRSWKSYD